MKLAVCTSAHGFGHTARQLGLIERLHARHAVTLFTHAPHLVEPIPNIDIQAVKWDVGLVQHDSFGVDIAATQAWLSHHVHSGLIDRIAACLASFDLCLCDINPMVMAACQQKGIPVVAVGNFSWSWIYSHFPALDAWTALFREWEGACDAIDISHGLGPGLSGFKSVTQAGRLVRQSSPVEELSNRVLLSFGGFGLKRPEHLMPEIQGVQYIAGAATAIHPRLQAYPNIPYAQLIACASVIVTKVGYGILTEAAQHGIPLLCLKRSDFPEAPYLEAWVRRRGDIVLEGSVDGPSFSFEYQKALCTALKRSKHAKEEQHGAADICRILGL